MKREIVRYIPWHPSPHLHPAMKQTNKPILKRQGVKFTTKKRCMYEIVEIRVKTFVMCRLHQAK